MQVNWGPQTPWVFLVKIKMMGINLFSPQLSWVKPAHYRALPLPGRGYKFRDWNKWKQFFVIKLTWLITLVRRERWFKHDILVERGLIGSLYTMYINYIISRVYQQSQKSESLAKRLILIPLHWAPVKRLICYSNEATPWNSWKPNPKSQTAYRFFNDMTKTKKAKQRIYLYIRQYLID